MDIAKRLEKKLTKNKIEKSGVYYGVQIGAFNKAPDKSVQNKLRTLEKQYPVYTYKTKSGLSAYVVGKSKKHKWVKSIQKDVKKSGFQDAYIVAFKNGNLISVNEAKKTEQ